MAPALPLAPSNEPEALDNCDGRSHPRRPLTSGSNFATPMDENVMGLQNQPSLVKDSQEMEEILVDLGRSDLANPFLLQAIKTFESAGDNISTMGDADPFPLPDFDLPEAPEPEVVSEKVADEAIIKVTQARLERRCAFLQRRLRILQTRAIGKRISEEVVLTFDKCTRGARRDGGGRPMGLKAFMKRIETTAALQASAASRTMEKPTYYHAGTSKDDETHSASIGIAPGTLSGLEDTAGALRSHLAMVNHQLDSDATASSSGAESNDEAVTYNNQHQQHMAIEKRALWTWQRARASIASRWCWLLAQIQELEYKIRQHCELHEQVREVKGAVQFEGEPSGYDKCLPGVEAVEDGAATETCARVRPLRRETFKKRKLLQMHNLHIATRKAAKPSDIGCSCQYPRESCPVCTGRAEPTQPAPSLSGLSGPQRIALLDPGFHPVLSDIRDVSPAIHLAAITSRPWFRARSVPKPVRGAHHSSAVRPSHQSHHQYNQHQQQSTTPPSNKRHAKRLKRGRPPLSRKNRDKDREEDVTLGHERSRGRTSTETRNRRNSYDIDNIVIPQSVAASTRPQILPYKEIITPKWRVLELPETTLNNGVSKSNRMSVDSEDEDISEPAMAARHTRAERRERTRFTRNSNRRAHLLPLRQEDVLAPPSPPAPSPPAPAPSAPTPAPSAPAPLLEHQTHVDTQPQTYHQYDRDSPQQEIVRPYTPRQFPLPDDMYSDMIAAMPDGYRRSTPEPPPPPTPPPPLEERSSTLSPMSPTIFDGDDPDDTEWEPNSEKSERRKSTLR